MNSKINGIYSIEWNPRKKDMIWYVDELLFKPKALNQVDPDENFHKNRVLL